MIQWREDDSVRVIAGAFKGFRGTVLENNVGGMIVLIEVFGRATPVALDADQLIPGDEGGGESR